MDRVSKRKATLAKKKENKNFELWRDFYRMKQRISELETLCAAQSRMLDALLKKE